MNHPDCPRSTIHHRRSPVWRCWRIALGLALGGGMGSAARLAAQAVDPVLPPASTLKKLSMDELMDMVVTSVSKRPEKLLDAASAIQVITDDDIRRAGATSIPEALRLATNLEVAQIDSRQWAISARGFNNLFADKMLVLIDGRSVYTPLYAGVYWDVQDTMLEDVDRIEVISGPGATQWGANAVNGVINVTTKSAKDTQGALFVEGAGTELLDSDEIRYGGILAPNVYYRVYAKYFDRDESVRPNGPDADDSWHTFQAGFRTDWDAGTGNTLTFQGDGYSGIMDQPGQDNIRASGGNALARWAHTIDEQSDMQLQVYFDRTHRRIPGSFTQNIDTYDIDYQYRLPVGTAHDVVWGLGYRLVEDDILNTPADAFLPPSVGRNLFSAFGQDEITLREDRLHLTVGSKVEHNYYTGFEVEPSVRLAWTPDNKQTIWAAVSRAVRTPSRIDTDLYSPADPPYRIAGGQNVVSEKMFAYELGYRVQLRPQLSFSLATFINNYDDLRSLEPLNPPQAFPAEASNGLEGTSKGAELTADWRVTPNWRLRAGWTELRVSSEPQAGSPDRATRDSIVRDPNHQGDLRSLLNLSDKWDLDADLRYVAPISNQAVPGYAELDLRIAWRPSKAWEISLTGDNLLHAHHAEFNTPTTRREIERSVFEKATWHF